MTPEQCQSLTPGTRVHHTVFGWGTVMRRTSGSFGGGVVFKFDTTGVKELASDFCASRLERDDTTAKKETT